MAELLGTITAAISVVTLTYDACKKVNDTARGLIGAPQTVKDIQSDLENLREVFQSIRQRLESTDRLTVFEPLRAPTNGCSAVCSRLEQELKKLTSHSTEDRTALRDRFRVLFNEKDLSVLRLELNHYKETFAIALNWANLQVAAGSQVEIQQLQADITASRSSLSGQIQALEISLHALSSSISGSGATGADAGTATTVLEGLRHYEGVLDQCLEAQTAVFAQASSQSTTSVDYSRAYDSARQLIGNIGDFGGVGGGASVKVGNAEARNEAWQLIGNVSADSFKVLVGSVNSKN